MSVSCCFFHSRTLDQDTRLAGTGLLKIYRAALKPHVILASSNSDIVEHGRISCLHQSSGLLMIVSLTLASNKAQLYS